MKLPRFTVRRLMVVVAVWGIVSWGIRLRELSARYRERADDYERSTRALGSLCNIDHLRSGPSGDEKRLHPKLDRIELFLSYYEAMKNKYERASNYPWLPVAPDPPEPE